MRRAGSNVLVGIMEEKDDGRRIVLNGAAQAEGSGGAVSIPEARVVVAPIVATDRIAPIVDAPVLARDRFFMGLALDAAERARQAGEVPVGAVVVRGDDVVATGFNHPIGGHDPSAHAEMVALRAAAQRLQNYRLPGCDLYVTLEPCPMCAGAIMHARIGRVIFGARDPKTGAAGSVVDLFAESRLNHHASVTAGVMEDECATRLRSFFAERRLAAKARVLSPPM